MIDPGSFTSKAVQVYICFLVFAAAVGGLFTLENLGEAEKAALQRCDSFLERSEIALGRTEHRQKTLVCPQPEVKRRATPLPSREWRSTAGGVQGLASW